MRLTDSQIAALAATPTDVLARLREGSYTTETGQNVSFTDGQTRTDAQDLYAVLKEEHATGSSNLENDIARQILTDLSAGKPLDNAQWGALHALLAKYAPQIAKLRASPDHHGQNYDAVAPDGKGRLA
jgi:hypothetical protein